MSQLVAIPTFVKDGPCTVHRYHWPKPLRIVNHHVQPLEMGGTDTSDNKVRVCDTGHYNIHRVMAEINHGFPQSGTKMERFLADVGFHRWVADGKPGRFVYQLWDIHASQ